jgi:HAD superfamily hydrolase (TIGR01549 family)
MGVILDLDLTMVDSSCAEDYRRARQWQEVYRLIPSFIVYDGITALLTYLSEEGVPVCVITSSPSTYCSRVLAQFRWKVDACVCYHDTSEHKPHPAPILEGLRRLNLPATSVVSVGDAPSDIFASQRAGVFAVAATWGTKDATSLRASRPDAIVERVDDLRAILTHRIPRLK